LLHDTNHSLHNSVAEITLSWPAAMALKLGYLACAGCVLLSQGRHVDVDDSTLLVQRSVVQEELQAGKQPADVLGPLLKAAATLTRAKQGAPLRGQAAGMKTGNAMVDMLGQAAMKAMQGSMIKKPSFPMATRKKDGGSSTGNPVLDTFGKVAQAIKQRSKAQAGPHDASAMRRKVRGDGDLDDPDWEYDPLGFAGFSPEEEELPINQNVVMKSFLGVADMIQRTFLRGLPRIEQTVEEKEREPATRNGFNDKLTQILEGTGLSSQEVLDEVIEWGADTLLEVRDLSSSKIRLLIDNLMASDVSPKSSLSIMFTDIINIMNKTGFTEQAFDLAPIVPASRLLFFLGTDFMRDLMYGQANMTQMGSMLRDLGNAPLHEPSRVLNDVASILETADRVNQSRHADSIVKMMNATVVLEAPFLADSFFLVNQLFKCIAGRMPLTVSHLSYLADVMHDIPHAVEGSGKEFTDLGDLTEDISIWSEQGKLTEEVLVPRMAKYFGDASLVGPEFTNTLLGFTDTAKYFICNTKAAAGTKGCEDAVLQRPKLPGQ